jgi:hypothetical protein
MEIIKLKDRPDLDQYKKLYPVYHQFNTLLAELRKKELNSHTVHFINDGITRVNLATGSEKELRKQIKNTQTGILKFIEKEHKLVTKNHYRNTWLAVGMAVFGIPFGVAFGVSLKNMAFLGIGLPIGMAIGSAVGASMDKKALDEGRQIDIEMKY